jgi:hypothetical protein
MTLSLALLHEPECGHCGAVNDCLFPACRSLIEVMQNSLFTTLIAEFGHEVKNICGMNNKSRGSFFSTEAVEQLRVHYHSVERES